jgi:SulP family sulfate permease
MFFANVDRIRQRVRAELAAGTKPRQVLLNMGASPVIGIVSHDLLSQLRDELSASNVELALARVAPEAEAFLKRSGLHERLGPDRVFASQNDAVNAFLRRHGGGTGS